MTSACTSDTEGLPDITKIKRTIDHWSPQRRNNAIPRDLVIDDRGLGYLRKRSGALQPYGHTIAARLQTIKPAAVPTKKGPSKGDSTAPLITNMIPAEGSIIGAKQSFSASITDTSGIKSVSFILTFPDGVTTQSVKPVFIGNDTWQITLQGFTPGTWSWLVVAKDRANRGGNTARSNPVNFTISTDNDTGGGNGGTNTHVISNAAWQAGGAVQTAAGRIFFEMPGNTNLSGPWVGYYCSGTVVTDTVSGRSIILTASHCVFDDTSKTFARNVMFIPNQDATSGVGTDTDCNNDPLGCWVAAFGVVDANWANTTFPNNLDWDYAYYVVSDTGSHVGTAVSSDSLDETAGSLPVSFLPPYFDDGDPSAASIDYTYALGYSFRDDPNFMYCAQDMTTEGAANWWLPDCALGGGSSGGPWIQEMNETIGSGFIISVNSWGYANTPGMAGPKLDSTSAECLFNEAQYTSFASMPAADGDAGLIVDYCQ